MFTRNAAVAVLTALFAIGSFGFPAGDGLTKRVKFARGKSSITLTNAVVRGDRDTYIVNARKGQNLTVRITSVERNAVFQVETPDGSYIEGAGEGDDTTNLGVLLPESGDYRIVVGGTRGNASYRLTISVR